jgi:hypothetical protein
MHPRTPVVHTPTGCVLWLTGPLPPTERRQAGVAALYALGSHVCTASASITVRSV